MVWDRSCLESERIVVNESFKAIITGESYENPKWRDVLRKNRDAGIRGFRFRDVPTFEVNAKFNTKMIIELMKMIGDCGYQNFKIAIRNKKNIIESEARFATMDSAIYRGIDTICEDEYTRLLALGNGGLLMCRKNEIRIRKLIVDLSGGSCKDLDIIEFGEIVIVEVDQSLNASNLIPLSRNIAERAGIPPIIATSPIK